MTYGEQQDRPPRPDYGPPGHHPSHMPPRQDGWMDLYRRIQALEFHAAAAAERNSIHGADIRKLRDKIEAVKSEHNATLTKVLLGVVGLVGSAVFTTVWGLISKAP